MYLGNNAAFVQFFLLKNCAECGLDPVPGLEPEPKILLSRNRNRNKSSRFHNTAGG
jgi:hypothetical protein